MNASVPGCAACRGERKGRAGACPFGSLGHEQVSGTVPLSLSGFDAVGVNSSAPAWLIVMLMSVVVRVGSTPVQLGFGQSDGPSVVVLGSVATA